MKKKVFSIVAILILAIFTAGCTQLDASGEQGRTLNVSAVGTVELEPDIARIRIGVRSQSTDAAEAFEDNNGKAEAIIESLAAFGVEKEDIQTSNFSIYSQRTQPVRDEESRMIEEDMAIEETSPPEEDEITEDTLEEDEEEESVLTTIVENTVSVTVRDLDSLGNILSSVVEQGANTIYGITFDIEDREAAVEEARQMAIADAQSQAEMIAETADVKLGAIQSISINESGSPLTRNEAYAMEEAAQGMGSVPISSGTLTVKVTVNISYKIN